MIIIDTHCDTLYARGVIALAPPRPGRERLSIEPVVTPEHLREGGVTLQVLALFAGPKGPAGDPAKVARAELDKLTELTDHGVRFVTDFMDAAEGETCAILSIEGAEIYEGSLDSLHDYYKSGVRMCALTWNHENELGYPHCNQPDKPLKPFGWEAVREMNRLGIAVDVSHLGPGGFWDLIERAEKPPMASHSCCRALFDHTRNLTDDQIRALILRKGWIGINFYPGFLTGGDATIEDVVRHVEHIVKLGGALNVGFGSDFDGIEKTPVGLEHPGKFGNLIEALRKRFDEATVKGIAGENFLTYVRHL